MWMPDFVDENTNVYYEIVATRQSFYRHRDKGHFDFMLKHKIPLMIALYVKAVLNEFYETVKSDYFIIRPYVFDFTLHQKEEVVVKEVSIPNKKGGNKKMAHIQAFVSSDLHKEIKKKAIDEDISISDFVKDALLQKLEQNKGNKAEAAAKDTVDQTN